MGGLDEKTLEIVKRSFRVEDSPFIYRGPGRSKGKIRSESKQRVRGNRTLIWRYSTKERDYPFSSEDSTKKEKLLEKKKRN